MRPPNFLQTAVQRSTGVGVLKDEWRDTIIYKRRPLTSMKKKATSKISRPPPRGSIAGRNRIAFAPAVSPNLFQRLTTAIGKNLWRIAKDSSRASRWLFAWFFSKSTVSEARSWREHSSSLHHKLWSVRIRQRDVLFTHSGPKRLKESGASRDECAGYHASLHHDASSQGQQRALPEAVYCVGRARRKISHYKIDLQAG